MLNVLQVLTKPAEVAKQHMSKRCQDLVSIMEGLIEDTPKIEDQLRLDVQDRDNSYYVSASYFFYLPMTGLDPYWSYDLFSVSIE